MAGQHKLYPLPELNWTHYTGNGNGRPFNFEGGDLANFGSRKVDGTDVVTLAAGARYKLSECVQFGGAVAFPLTGHKDLFDFRVGFDVIFPC